VDLPRTRFLPELPSRRSVAAGVALFVVAAGAYAGARETSVFAVRAIEIRGASPPVTRQVRAALRPELGTSLLRIDGDVLDRRLAAVADVESIRFDRAFPHTLRIVVRPERPVALLRQGASAWVVSARGRVLTKIAHPGLSSLPRVWIDRKASVQVGGTVSEDGGGRAVHALVPLREVRLPGRVATVRAGVDEVTLVLRSGAEVRLGDTGDLRLKLAIAQRILRAEPTSMAAPAYLDVSVPERPVVSSNTQVAG
jgi:cell division protein FtsQ